MVQSESQDWALLYRTRSESVRPDFSDVLIRRSRGVLTSAADIAKPCKSVRVTVPKKQQVSELPTAAQSSKIKA